MLRAILFDFNGVIVDDEPIHFELFQEVLREEGIELSREDYYADYLGFDDQGCFDAVFQAVGREVTQVYVARLIARKATYYQTRIREQGFPIFPGAAELIREAVDSDLHLGVVSGALRPEIDGALAQLGVREQFKFLVPAEDVEASKPDPEGYRKGISLLNSVPPLPERLLHPHEILAIEDSPAGLNSAVGAGLVTLGVAQTYDIKEIEGIADRVVPSLKDVNLAQIRSWYADAV